MSLLSSRLFSNDRISSFKSYLVRHLNFYRIHLLFFTFTPLIFSGVFYAANGEFHIDYIDCLFNCVSAMTVCGLATVDLSSLTSAQQALLFVQMCLGSPVLISWTMVCIRRNFFARKFQHIVEAELARRIARETHSAASVQMSPWWVRLGNVLTMSQGPSIRTKSSKDGSLEEGTPVKPRGRHQLSTDMIRRIEGAPKLVDPSGWISEGVSEKSGGELPVPSEKRESEGKPTSGTDTMPTHIDDTPERPQTPEEDIQRHLNETSPRVQTSPMISAAPILRTQTINRPRGPQLGRTQTVEFAATPQPISVDRRFSLIPQSPAEEDETPRSPRPRRSTSRPRPSMSHRTMSRPTSSRHARTTSIPRTATMASHRTQQSRRTVHTDFGGFPMPHELLSRLFGRAFPKLERKLTRTITIPHTQTITSEHGTIQPGARAVPYISFEAVVGRNSVFQALTSEQLEELGGVEYRALTALLWIVGAYHIGLQLLAFVVIAPYMSIPRWNSDLNPPALHNPVDSTWYSAFQVVSGYTNTGMSLVDTSLVPFQQAYPLIAFMIILVLAGNTAFPVLLRFMIWILTKLFPKRSRTNETLHFLLDHPRRCFVYLFPSHQTWFLLTVLLALNFTDWFFFLVLDIGNQAIDSIPVGVRIFIGFLQATAVRAAGFGTVGLAALAPAVKVLYVVMMYISVYPIAMSVRSTNVYEEKSLGVYHDDDDDTEAGFNPHGSRAAVWGRYLAMHARRQLSFDMWWLGLALFLVCIIERDGIEDESNNGWFTIFTIIFELVSAYGSVGLSLGVPFANYSFSGALRPLSKLIICVVMLRARHRGLPVAIDRAVMLPSEFKEGQADDDAAHYDDESIGRSTRSTSPTSSSSISSDSSHRVDDSHHYSSGRETRKGMPLGIRLRENEKSPTRGRRVTVARRPLVPAGTV